METSYRYVNRIIFIDFYFHQVSNLGSEIQAGQWELIFSFASFLDVFIWLQQWIISYILPLYVHNQYFPYFSFENIHI